MFQRLRDRVLGRPRPAEGEKLSRRIAAIEKDIHVLADQQRDLVRRLQLVQGGFDRVDRLEQDLRALTEQHEEVFRLLRRLQAGVDGLVRAEYLEPDALPYPQRLTAARFRLQSQNSEDGMLLALFRQIGTTSKRFVELGSGSSGGNAAMFAGEFGWTGLMVEGDAGKAAMAARRFPHVRAVCAWITPESANALIEQHGLAGEVDLLSLDVDGNDYWVWQALTACRARVVVLEYNSMFGPDRAVTIPYDPNFNRRDHRFCYFGASLAALTQLSATKGYRLVAVEPTGINAMFLRNDLAPEIPAIDPGTAFRISDKYNELLQRKDIDVYAWAAEHGRQIVDVG
ncbi:MAG TPA: hypothetical protein VL173_08475 [Vicinamibacterales bacterium]|nr:hypothetical protein [Vicinamibacterales bacterium]